MYRGLNTTSTSTEWHARIFLNNGVVRCGDYFLRNLNTETQPPTCEFVTFTGGFKLDKDGKEVRESWVKKEQFDFKTITINEPDGTKQVTYTITSFDSYAFFNKLYCEENLEIDISDRVETIGQYAFASGSRINASNGLSTVNIAGNPQIMGYAFSNNDVLVYFNAPELTSLYGGYNLYNNGAFFVPIFQILRLRKDYLWKR
jgi:hypothetical protein